MNTNRHLIVMSLVCNLVTVKASDPNPFNSSIKAEVNDLSPTADVGFSLAQAASNSFVVPVVVSRTAFAAKQQSNIIRTLGTAVSRSG